MKSRKKYLLYIYTSIYNEKGETMAGENFSIDSIKGAKETAGAYLATNIEDADAIKKRHDELHKGSLFTFAAQHPIA